jgi:5-methylcytosine-specific restriction endonuclease McrA
MTKNGKNFNCTICGDPFYRSRSDIERGRTKICGKAGCRKGPRPYARKGATFDCVICGTQFYRSPSDINRGLTKTCGASHCRTVYMARPRPGLRPYRKTGTILKCVVCGDEFYRRKSYIERGIKNTCGKSACKSQFFSGANNPVWGRIPNEENRRAVRQSNLARRHKRTGPPKGYKHTLEARTKISAALRERWRLHRDEMIAKLTKPKPRDEMRYRREFTPWQKTTWKGTVCAWCRSTDGLELDHIIPIVAGGLNIKGNSQTLCRKCNLWKMAYVDRPYFLATLATNSRLIPPSL